MMSLNSPKYHTVQQSWPCGVHLEHFIRIIFFLGSVLYFHVEMLSTYSYHLACIYMAIHHVNAKRSTVTKYGTDRQKVTHAYCTGELKKGTCHVFYMATPCHATEGVGAVYDSNYDTM